MAKTQSIPASRRAECARCGKHVWKSRTSAAVQVCRACRAVSSVPRPRVDHGTASRYDGGCRCDSCREAKVAKERDYRRRRASEGRPVHHGRRRIAAKCAGCGVEYMARVDMVNAGKGRFCSSGCHDAFQTTTGRRARDRKARRERGPLGSVRWRALRRAESALNLTGGSRVWVQGACAVCGDQYLSPGAASRYCSKACREKNRANRPYGLSWLDRMALFARDGWTCGICSELVDYSADVSSDWYPTIDHIVPRSRGGSDELSNLRTAHRWCNSVRGDLTYYTDADLAA